METPRRTVRFEPYDERAVEANRRMGGPARIAMVDDLYTAAREMMAARVKQQHPGWARHEIDREVTRRLSRETE